MAKLNPIVQWWMTPKLPLQHIFISPENKPKGLLGIFRLYFRKWIVHPIKRRAAKYYLLCLRRFTNIKVIGITGSAGKTTTKEMIASILKTQGKTVYSRDNIDPIYNIPTTILGCTLSTKYLVLEMGVEYPGEMDFYLWLGKVDIGVITNIYPTHIEYFGDTGGVFREKSKLVERLSSNGVAVLNYGDKLLRQLSGKIKSKIIWFGDETEVKSYMEKTTDDYKTRFIMILDNDENKKVEVTLPIMGIQFVHNALTAAGVAKALEISLDDIKHGLETFDLPSHRMKVIKHKSGAVILDDSYNNNPMAATEAINTFEEFALGKDKVIVFGDMLELGDSEEKYHKELGEYLGRIKLSKLICVGRASKITAETAVRGLGVSRVGHVDNIDAAYVELEPYLRKNTAILIKGSRSINLDKLVEKL